MKTRWRIGKVIGVGLPWVRPAIPVHQPLLPKSDTTAVQRRDASVMFPVVGPETDGGSLIEIGSMRVPEWDNDKRPIRVLGGTDHANARKAVDILANARRCESPTTADQGVQIKFKTWTFQGQSHGLALALADKLVRFYDVGGWRPPAIIATGEITADGDGRVAAVKGFAEKIVLIADHLNQQKPVPPVLLAVPMENWEAADASIKSVVEGLIANAVIDFRPVRHIDDLECFWKNSAGTLAPPAPPDRFGFRWTAGIFSSIVAIVGAFHYLDQPAADPAEPSLLERCDTALANARDRNDAGLRRAFKACAALQGTGSTEAALRLGRLHDLNDAPAIAESYWRRVAEDGDPMGQARLGSLLRERNAGATVDAEAVRWLTMAARQGMQGALDDLGWMYLLGRGVPPDEVMATALWRAAADHRIPKELFE